MGRKICFTLGSFIVPVGVAVLSGIESSLACVPISAALVLLGSAGMWIGVAGR